MVFAAQPLDVLELARQYFQAGDLDRAALLFAQVLQTHPEQLGALNGLGVVAFQRQEFATAAEWFTRALAVEPHSAKVQTNLGNALMALEQLEEALVCYQKAIALDADFALAHFNLANLLVRQEQFAEAMAEYRHTVALKPDFLEAHLRLAGILRNLGKMDEEVAVYRDAIALNPEMAELHNELGDALESQGEWEAAACCYREAIRLWPDWAEAHCNYASLLMLRGDLRAGLAESEWRWQTPLFLKSERTFGKPAWDGSDLAGKRILVRAEQGFGDMIQFVRFASLLKARGATVIFESYAPLLSLLSSYSGIDELVLCGAPLPPYDLHAAMMSLPLLLDVGTTLETIPAQVPYLYSPARCKLPLELQAALSAPAPLKVGIVWAPALRFSIDYQRYCPLEHFESLLKTPGVAFFSLYKGERTTELAPYGERIVDVGTHCTDFADTAWAIDRLDLVITVDTAAAHLAGALGKPVWLLLSFVPDWRWLLERTDSPWYPTACLFRQPAPGDWAAVLASAAATLRMASS
ncbi:tetratricopeptide repeat protein [Gloeobacter kilaueensis]|uniref:TPR repeat-containing protein n=1 Tax=Gloeobacter kilaueensis (strain ATCC BAA-2537 / CCAP 1431/1 / ULC 316 / JS1) TaxID=1183438 RepID=U5QNB1_GLOK1|nr:tetratricopeptide repeat protein [Gloeobacter kilaueensis]AGY59094.1 TPR repeat-containing protein [Gloeobacter kilaueensis JS1]